MQHRDPAISVARPAWKFFIPLALLAAVGGWFFWPAGIVFGILALYVLYFFRDPRRQVPNIPGAFVSPADGKIVSVIEVPCERFPGGRAQRIAIFLNIFNVHIQRASYAGKVVGIDRKPGKFINALNEKCSEENEQVTIWLENDEGVFGIRQIAGAIARRIVCDVKEGDWLERGQRYGLIQFGSRVELFVPLTANVKVQPGQKVKGGENCLALLHEEEARKGKFPTKEVQLPRDLAEVS
ncbi:MAG: phosphatidylserine decarboxylase [Candidatus Sumerlaeota bacterium]|nr:phosphatidylserine decarboxylase [Candidatus Sumerlaeota bacterium]